MIRSERERERERNILDIVGYAPVGIIGNWTNHSNAILFDHHKLILKG